MSIYRRPKQMKLKENLYANIGEFFYADGTEFEGYYHMFDIRKKKYFEGETYAYSAKEIFPQQKIEFSEDLNREYTNIWREIGDKTLEIKKIQEPTSFIPSPTLKNLEEGEMDRFLLLQRNSFRVYEIDENQHKAYKKSANPYNSNYKVAKTTWYLTGPLFSVYSPAGIELKQGIYERNYQQRALILDTIPKFSPILSNLLEYTLPDPEDDLYSDGSFLYLPNGQKYVGKYHIHPAKGPMVGSTHTTATHSKLKILI